MNNKYNHIIRLWTAAVKSSTAKVYCSWTTYKSGTAFAVHDICRTTLIGGDAPVANVN